MARSTSETSIIARFSLIEGDTAHAANASPSKSASRFMPVSGNIAIRSFSMF
jgi:hypothetical protein